MIILNISNIPASPTPSCSMELKYANVFQERNKYHDETKEEEEEEENWDEEKEEEK